MFPLDKRSSRRRMTWNAPDGREWTVYTEQEKLPSTMGNDLWVALGVLWNVTTREDTPGKHPDRAVPDNRTVRTTLGELCDLLNKTRGTNTYREMAETLMDFRSVRFLCKGTIKRPGGAWGTVDDFDLLTNVRFEVPLDPGVLFQTDDRGIPRRLNRDVVVVAVFSEEIVRSIDERMYRLLDMSVYRRIRSSTGRKLYRFLDLWRRRGRDRVQNPLPVRLADLRDRLPLAGATPSDLRKVLDPAHEALQEMGWLAHAEYTPMKGTSGRFVDEVRVLYTFTDSPVAVLRASTTADGDSEPLGDGAGKEGGDEQLAVHGTGQREVSRIPRSDNRSDGNTAADASDSRWPISPQDREHADLLVKDLVTELGDYLNKPWYIWLANRVPHDTLRRALSEVVALRAMKQPVADPGALFTRLVTEYVSETYGIDITADARRQPASSTGSPTGVTAR